MRHLKSLIVLTALVAGCTEPRVVASASTAVGPRLEWSDPSAPTGATVTGMLRFDGAGAPTIGSFTARLAYDSTALRFVEDVAMGDSATRVSNPQPGLVRVAGAAANGFASGQLYAAHFVVLKRDALASVLVRFDELHATDRSGVRVP